MNSKDLTKGDKQYLKGQGLSEAHFDKMPERDKHEWKEECQEQAYIENYSRAEAVGSKSFTIGKPTPETQRIWEQKETLINQILQKSNQYTFNGLAFQTPESLEKICQELT